MNLIDTIKGILGLMTGFIISVIVIAILTLPIWLPIILLTSRKKNNNNNQEQYQNQNQVIQYNTTIETQQEASLPYVLNKQLLTNKEKSFYQCIKPIMDKYNYIIFSKMRIVDIVSVTAPKEEFMPWFNKINKKHIDFIICNENFEPLLLIEIDDYTHDRYNRKVRDEFVDNIFKNQKINLLHIRQWDNTLEDIVINAIVNKEK